MGNYLRDEIGTMQYRGIVQGNYKRIAEIRRIGGHDSYTTMIQENYVGTGT